MRSAWRAIWRSVLAVVVTLVLLSSSALAESRSTINLGKIADEYYWTLQDRLVRPNFSAKANKSWVGKLEKYENRLNRIKVSNLDGQAKLTHRMLQKELKFQREYVTNGWINRDINGTDSPAQSVAEWADSSQLRTVAGWKWTIKTLENSETFMSSYIQILDEGLKSGKAQPKQAIQSAIDSLDVLTSSSASKNPFLLMEKSLETSMKGKKQLPDLRKELRRVVHKKVIPAHKKLRAFLKTKYLPKAGKLGADREAYLYQMGRHLGAGHDSPETLHAWGKSEVRRLRRELRKTAKKINPKAKNLSTFMNGFNRRKVNQYKNANDFIVSAHAEVKRTKKLAREQVPVPRSKVAVKPVPKYQEATVAAQYYPTGTGQGVMEVNTGKLLSSQRRSDLATLVTHEVYSGHHLAAMYAQKAGDRLPSYRTENANTAFDEGWALYSEQLRDESGGFTPKERVGYLVNHLWRASRLVVDTGLHTGTMTPAQAREFFQRNTFVTKDVARSEIERYINWPGQALAYYVGKREILQIRTQVKKVLGKKYDARKFHAKMLSMGSVPPKELRKSMLSWAKRRKAQPRTKRRRTATAASRARLRGTRTRARTKAAAKRTAARRGFVKRMRGTSMSKQRTRAARERSRGTPRINPRTRTSKTARIRRKARVRTRARR